MYKILRVLLIVLFASGISQAQILFVSSLSGAAENPPVTTEASGTAWALLSPDFGSLTYHVTYAQLEGSFTASHFHIGAAGTNGGVVHAVTFNGNTASGVWNNLPDSIIGRLMKGEIYINVHSSFAPGGEIRGQMRIAEGIGFNAALNGSEETPPVTTGASGTAWAVLDAKAGTVTYSSTIAGLSAPLTAAHFHNAPQGTSGGVVQAVSFTDSSTSGVWNISDAHMLELLKERIYLNVHSQNYPAGEIRGQMMRQGELMLTADLNGAQENPAVVTEGTGTAYGVLNSTLNALSYRATYAELNGSFTAAHFHLGAAGSNGGVVHPIAFNGNTASGEWTALADSMLLHLLKENIYLNVHSNSSPSGEIRGQMLVRYGAGMTAALDGSQENPPVNTGGSGTGWFVFDTEGNSVDYRITAAGLSSALTAAHFHAAAEGMNGGVINAIPYTDSTVTSSWADISSENLGRLVKGNIYVNIHTTNNPGGEIRGQVKFSNIISGNIPVELTSFSAASAADGIELRWSTATETNNKGFEVERSSDGKNYNIIAFIGGAGTTAEPNSYYYLDAAPEPGRYYYRLKQIDLDGSYTYYGSIEAEAGIPERFELAQNYPNPFNPSTSISFSLPVRTEVTLQVYNIIGSEAAVLNLGQLDQGSHTVSFNGADLASGIYIYVLKTGAGFTMQKKMTLLK